MTIDEEDRLVNNRKSEKIVFSETGKTALFGEKLTFSPFERIPEEKYAKYIENKNLLDKYLEKSGMTFKGTIEGPVNILFVDYDYETNDPLCEGEIGIDENEKIEVYGFNDEANSILTDDECEYLKISNKNTGKVEGVFVIRNEPCAVEKKNEYHNFPGSTEKRFMHEELVEKLKKSGKDIGNYEFIVTHA